MRLGNQDSSQELLRWMNMDDHLCFATEDTETGRKVTFGKKAV